MDWSVGCNWERNIVEWKGWERGEGLRIAIKKMAHVMHEYADSCTLKKWFALCTDLQINVHRFAYPFLIHLLGK